MLQLQLLAIIGYVNQGKVCNGNHATGSITVHITEAIELLHVYIRHTGKLFQHTASRSIHTLIPVHKTTHERPLSLLRLEATLDKQGLYLLTVEPNMIQSTATNNLS